MLDGLQKGKFSYLIQSAHFFFFFLPQSISTFVPKVLVAIASSN